MKNMNLTRIIVIAALLVAFVATSTGTSFAATKSSTSQNYTSHVQSATIATQPKVFVEVVAAAGAALAGAAAVAGQVTANAAANAAAAAAESSSSSSSSSVIVHPINPSVSTSAKSAFGR